MKSLAVVAASLWLTGWANAGDALPSKITAAQSTPNVVSSEPPITLDSLLDPPSAASTGVSDLRMQMLTDAGKTVGFRGGLAARARVLLHALDTRSTQLDTMFQFSPLLTKTGAIPPVIVEARDVAAFSPDQIRTATRVYKIEKEERFVSVPPTWRDYLVVGLPTKDGIDLPALEARPQDDKEKLVWKSAVMSGWEEGQKQADGILTANFHRLTRDYSGMVLYSTLLQQGMISTTQVAEAQQTVTGDSKELILGDKLKRLMKKAAFETDAAKWSPTVTRKKQATPKPVTGTSQSTIPTPGRISAVESPDTSGGNDR